MVVPFSMSALVIAHFVREHGPKALEFACEHGAGHLVGGEVHHFYRQFIERWQESKRDPATGLPRNHDLEEAGEEALRAAVTLLVVELAGRIEPKKPWLTRKFEKFPNFRWAAS